MLHVAPLGFLSFSTGGYVPAGAIWLDGSADYLSWTPGGAPDDGTEWWLSVWIKDDGQFDGNGAKVILGAGISGTNRYILDIDSTNYNLRSDLYESSQKILAKSAAAYRDYSAWRHVAVHYDSDEATAADRYTVYDNGEEVTFSGSPTYPASAATSPVLSAVLHRIGLITYNTVKYWSGYMADFAMVDGGGSLTIADFGETDALGNWVPKDLSGLTFGTNGFWLDFADSADLGNDVSGNGNDWTLNSMSSANATNDNPVDDAANGYGNFMLWNPLEPGTKPTFSNGNTTESHSASDVPAFGNWVFSDGLWQIELTADVFTAGDWIGVCNEDFAQGTDIAVSSDTWVYKPSTGYKSNGTGDPGTAYGSGASATDRINIALDMDQGDGSNKIWIGVNGTWENSGDPAAGTGAMYSNLPARVKLVQGSRSSSAGTFTINLSLTDALETGFKQPVTYSLPAPTPAASATPITGSFTGNANADGPVVWLGYTPDTSETSTINSNTITWGTHALPTAGGMKIITSSASYNTAGSNTYSIAVEHPFGGEGVSQARAR